MQIESIYWGFVIQTNISGALFRCRITVYSPGLMITRRIINTYK